MTYIDVPLEVDPDAITAEMIADLQSRISGWLPAGGDAMTILIEVLAQRHAILLEQLTSTLQDVFRVYGVVLQGVPVNDASRASVASTWTMRDNAGYTIKAGWTVGLRAAGDELVAFQVQDDVVVPPGSTATAAGEVTLVAVEPGAQGTGLSGTVELIDNLDVVASVAVVDSTAGGRDGETTDEYLDRLSAELRRYGPRVIVPDDFAAEAQEVAGDGYRALALDGYDPGADTFGHDKMVTVVLRDPTGEPATTGVKNAVDAAIQAKRETNFDVRVIDPTYTTVNVTFSFKALSGYDAPTVKAAAEAAVAAYLSPASWGAVESDELSWMNTTVVRYGELYAVLNAVAGLDYVTALSIQGSPDTNLTLSGRAPLPRPGTITGTAV